MDRPVSLDPPVFWWVGSWPGARLRSCSSWWRPPQPRPACGCSAYRRNGYRAGMSTYPGQQPAAAPKKTLTWIAIACFAIGLVLTAFFVVRIVQTAPRTPQPIEGGVVHLKKEGL